MYLNYPKTNSISMKNALAAISGPNIKNYYIFHKLSQSKISTQLDSSD